MRTMMVFDNEPLVVLCQACGAMSIHHPYVKPSSPLVGLVCSRCGQVLDMGPCCGNPKSWLSEMELTQ